MRVLPVNAQRLALTPVAFVVWGLCQPAQAEPAADVNAPLQLRATPRLQERLSQADRQGLPTFISGDRIQGRPDAETVLDGNAELRRGDALIRADRIDYQADSDIASARGNVRINKGGNVFEGPELQLKVESFEGFMASPRYRFLRSEAYGSADRIDFIDDKRAVMRNASYTSCSRQPGPSWLPDWILQATTVRFDTEEEVGIAEGAQLRFFDVPILPFPEVSFPLTEKRKSGFLPPTVAIDNLSGVEVSVPYYWNIAPNRDATFFLAVLARRGVNLGGEFRYLEPTHRGELRADFMPSDRLRDERSRWGLSSSHSGTIDTGLAAVGLVGGNLSINRVSDDNYWRDFPRAVPALTQRLLATDGSLYWARGDWSATARALKWQTLQDVSAPIIPPYDRLPQLTARYARSNVNGFDFSLEGDFSAFRSDRVLNQQPNADRSVVLGQASRPFTTPGSFIVPKVQLHATQYQFDAPLAGGASSASRVLPTFSLDSGLVFERAARYFGRDFTQTLEPRAFYVYTPGRDQSRLPNYDSAANDFNFASIYTENSFVGNDRIADNNLLTVGVSSRLLDPGTGAETARVGVAQRLRLTDQTVTLPGQAPVKERLSDLLLGGALNWSPRWGADALVQYNPDLSRSVRATLGARYSPGSFRTISAAYRFQRDVSEQIDIGWQWPLDALFGAGARGRDAGAPAGRLYTVGRLNYSIADRRVTDTVLGFEYDAGCWIGRAVVERLQNSTNTSTKRILFQLEFIGFSSLGSNPLQSLKNNIPRYQLLREKTTTPSRFGNYE